MRNLDEMPQEAQELYRKYKQRLEDKWKSNIEDSKRHEQERREFWSSAKFAPEIIPQWIIKYIQLDQPILSKRWGNVLFVVPGLGEVQLYGAFYNGIFIPGDQNAWSVWHKNDWLYYSTLDEAIYQVVTRE